MVDEKIIDLELNESDAAVSVARTISSLIPIAGSFLAEVFTVLIPNQQKERVVETLKLIVDKVQDLEERIKDPEQLDLFQDAIIQATRALSPERRQYISNILKNSLSIEEQSHDQKKKLFIILNSLNDTEIIILKYYSYVANSPEANDFRNNHRNILRHFRELETEDDSETNRETFYESYNKNFERLGLILEEATRFTGMRSRELTQLGKLLLKYIEVPD